MAFAKEFRISPIYDTYLSRGYFDVFRQGGSFRNKLRAAFI